MDPRLDHRIAGWLMKTNERYPAQMPDVTMDMDYDQVLKFIDYMHGAVTSTNKELFATMPAFKGVQSREYSIQGDGGHKIKLFVDSPKTRALRHKAENLWIRSSNYSKLNLRDINDITDKEVKKL